MRNKFAYSSCIKIHALGFDELLESISCLLLVVEAFSLQKNFKMLQELVVGWRVRWIWQIRQNFIAQFIQLCLAVQHVVGHRCRELGPVYWPMPVLQFSVYLIDLLSILLRCNGFTGIHKAVVDQMGSRAPNSDHDLLLVPSLTLESTLEPPLSPTTELVIVSCCIKSTFCHMLQSNREMVHCCCTE